MPPPHDDGFYDDQPRGGRRKGLLTVVAVLGLAVIGTAGAFGYRTMVRGSGSSASPPVIRASAEPSKVAPPPPRPTRPRASSATIASATPARTSRWCVAKKSRWT